MSDPNRSQMTPGEGRKISLPSRKLAILLMVVGAVGFTITLLWLGNQILCLLGSTLITFIGLGFTIADRCYHPAVAESASSTVRSEEKEQSFNVAKPVQILQAPPELGAISQGYQADNPSNLAPDSRPAIRPVEIMMKHPPSSPAEPPGFGHAIILGEPPAKRIDLLQKILELFQSTGVQVIVETQQPGRAILQVTGNDGATYTALVHDRKSPVEVAEIRALQSLVTSSGSSGGYLFSSGTFTPQAYAWADARKIRLVMADELDEISL